MPENPMTKLACVGPVLAAIYISYQGLHSMLPSDLANICTFVLACCSWLLSTALHRWFSVKHDKVMAGVLIVLMVIYASLEAFFVHVGAVVLLKAGDGMLYNDAVVWGASISLAIINIFSKWGFLGTPTEEKEEAPAAAPVRQDPPSLELVKTEYDEKIEAAMGRIGDRIRAS
ncbi:MAG: hypothetical protein AAFY82_00240 [Pseudomonadota bacterium]